MTLTPNDYNNSLWSRWSKNLGFLLSITVSYARVCNMLSHLHRSPMSSSSLGASYHPVRHAPVHDTKRGSDARKNRRRRALERHGNSFERLFRLIPCSHSSPAVNGSCLIYPFHNFFFDKVLKVLSLSFTITHYSSEETQDTAAMANIPEVIAGDSPVFSEKPQLQSSTNEELEAGTDVYSQANPARPGFTKSDQQDMWRMGRIQELKVSQHRMQFDPNKLESFAVADAKADRNCVARLSSSRCLEFCYSFDCSMGIFLDVCREQSI